MDKLIARTLRPSKVVPLENSQLLIRIPLNCHQGIFNAVIDGNGMISFPGFDSSCSQRLNVTSVERSPCEKTGTSESIDQTLQCDEDFSSIESAIGMQRWIENVMRVKGGRQPSMRHLHDHDYYYSMSRFHNPLRDLIDKTRSVYQRYVSLQNAKTNAEPYVFGLKDSAIDGSPAAVPRPSESLCITLNSVVTDEAVFKRNPSENNIPYSFASILKLELELELISELPSGL
ncbi:unnamed protein product [Soboliphyme baturini]|uniref:Uncharacterized protein n=1 Tax=Soboliphyme baturini TaxID=241478 RepID=A0A183IJC9_9BILA|nr:unnamed protein product [Soboliphyme baturini]